MTENVAVVKMERRPDLATAMLGKQWDPGDLKRCGGKGSGTIIYLDADTSELVLMVKITESKDLTDVDRTVFNSIFSKFAKGMKSSLRRVSIPLRRIFTPTKSNEVQKLMCRLLVLGLKMPVPMLHSAPNLPTPVVWVSSDIFNGWLC
jgi:hypothetical protein